MARTSFGFGLERRASVSREANRVISSDSAFNRRVSAARQQLESVAKREWHSPYRRLLETARRAGLKEAEMSALRRDVARLTSEQEIRKRIDEEHAQFIHSLYVRAKAEHSRAGGTGEPSPAQLKRIFAAHKEDYLRELSLRAKEAAHHHTNPLWERVEKARDAKLTEVRAAFERERKLRASAEKALKEERGRKSAPAEEESRSDKREGDAEAGGDSRRRESLLRDPKFLRMMTPETAVAVRAVSGGGASAGGAGSGSSGSSSEKEKEKEQKSKSGSKSKPGFSWVSTGMWAGSPNKKILMVGAIVATAIFLFLTFFT